MKRIIMTGLLLLAVQAAHAQQAVMKERKPGETLQEFAQRVISNADRLDHVVEGDFGASRGNVVIFFERTDSDNASLHGWVLVPDESVGYKKYEIDANGYARFSTVKSIFFANTDVDREKELVVLTFVPSPGLIRGQRVDLCVGDIFDWTGDRFAYLEEASYDFVLGSDKCTAADARRLLGIRPKNTRAKSGLSGGWQWRSALNKNTEQTLLSVDLEQKDGKVTGNLWYALLIHGENDGPEGSSIPFVGVVKGDAVMIEFDPKDLHSTVEEHVRYKRPKSPSTATLRLKNGRLEWTQTKGAVDDLELGIPSRFLLSPVD